MNKIIPSVTSSFVIFLIGADAFGGQCTEVPGVAGNYSALTGVAVISPSDVWAVGAKGHANSRTLIEHWDGTSWSEVLLGEVSSQLDGVAAASSTDVWAVGANAASQTLVMHWNGQRWLIVASPNIGSSDTLTGICVISRNDAWAVGYSSFSLSTYILVHWDGTSWSLVDGPPADGASLFSVKAFATNNVWAVGSKSDSIQNTSSTFILHWDGTGWSEVASPDAGDFRNSLGGVDGANPNDVWAVGSSANKGDLFNHALTLHWDGVAWIVVPTSLPDDSAFSAVAALSSTNVVAIGESKMGTILLVPCSANWDGIQWHRVPTPPVIDDTGFLFAISQREGSLWTVGYQGLPEQRNREPQDLIFNWTQ
jgi:hypothetical protein